jgi:hypothetical protein
MAVKKEIGLLARENYGIYERIIRPAFYGIYEVVKAQVEVDYLVEDRFELVPQNERGHYPIAQIGLELGIWQGVYPGVELPWLRWWDASGNLLLAAEERAEQAELAAEREGQRRIEAELRLQALEARLRQLEGE